jgi:flagellar protein FliS
MNPYFEQQILGANPVELVRLIYQQAISSVSGAREHLRCRRVAERSQAVTHAYRALHELMDSLRPGAAPEIARRLRELYCYMQQRLLDANMRQEDEPLAEVQGLLMTLAQAWDGVAAQMDSQVISAVNRPEEGWTETTAAMSLVAAET